jgi:Na+-driven multidrug efflux pump
MSYMPAFAFQMAITTLVAQSLGAKKPDLAVRFLKWTMGIGAVVMAITTAFLYIFAAPIIGIFTPDAEVIAVASECLKVVALIQVPQMAAWVFAGLLRGSGDTKVCFYITASTNWGVRTLFSVIAVRLFNLPLIAVVYVMCVEILIRLAVLYLRYKSGKWKTAMEHNK